MIKKNIKLIIFVAIVSITVILYFFYRNESKEPKNKHPEINGYVSDKETAINVAIAILEPMYGNKVNKNKPFHAKIINDSIWIIEGTAKPNQFGGVIHAEINKKDGRILKVFVWK